MSDKLDLLEQKSKLADELMVLYRQINDSYWDDAFVDEPEYSISARRDLIRKRDAKNKELERINTLLKNC